MKTKQFQANAGLGWLFFSKQIGENAQIWEGNVTLPSGQRARFQAVAISDTKKNGGSRWEIKALNVDAQAGDMWKNLGEFSMPAFGNKNAQTVNTKLGRVRIWRQMPRGTTKACLRIRFMSDDKGVYSGPIPM